MAKLRTIKNAGRRGAALVEAAIVTPLVMLLVMGCVEYGWMMLKAQDISNAARRGARAGALAWSTSSDINTAVSAAMTQAGLDSSGYVVTITPSDPTTLSSGANLTVRVSVPYANIGVINIALIPTPTNLRSTVVMAREGP
jgi:Flp pilus assembly protein TadG